MYFPSHWDSNALVRTRNICAYGEEEYEISCHVYMNLILQGIFRDTLAQNSFFFKKKGTSHFYGAND